MKKGQVEVKPETFTYHYLNLFSAIQIQIKMLSMIIVSSYCLGTSALRWHLGYCLSLEKAPRSLFLAKSSKIPGLP